MIPLGLALRFVLDAVRKPPDSKMYFFGVAALDRFKTRLKDYPQYCQHVSVIAHFKDFPNHLIDWVEFGANSQTPPNRPQGPVVPPTSNPSTTTAPPGPPPGPPTGPPVTTVPPAPVIKPTAPVTAATTSATTSSTIVRPAVSQVGRPSIANTTNIGSYYSLIHKMKNTKGLLKLRTPITKK